MRSANSRNALRIDILDLLFLYNDGKKICSCACSFLRNIHACNVFRYYVGLLWWQWGG